MEVGAEAEVARAAVEVVEMLRKHPSHRWYAGIVTKRVTCRMIAPTTKRQMIMAA